MVKKSILLYLQTILKNEAFQPFQQLWNSSSTIQWRHPVTFLARLGEIKSAFIPPGRVKKYFLAHLVSSSSNVVGYKEFEAGLRMGPKVSSRDRKIHSYISPNHLEYKTCVEMTSFVDYKILLRKFFFYKRCSRAQKVIQH